MNIAVVGATGVVGETILRVLEERALPVARLGAFASRDRDAAVTFRGAAQQVRATSVESLLEYDLAFFAGSDEASERFAPPLIERGRVVIDNSATFRLDDAVPLVVPEVNAHTVKSTDRLFPVGNCTAIILCVALAAVRDAAGLARVRVATYQAVSGAGRSGLEEFHRSESALVAGEPEPAPQAFAKPIARNVIPQIGAFGDDGLTGEERKVRDETRKILELPRLPLTVLAVRVPVRTAHSEAVFVETERETSVHELREAFERAAGVRYHTDVITPREVEGRDEVHVGRFRAEDESGRRFVFWVVGDQLRKGAATNGVQIAELLVQRGMLRAG